MRSAALQALRHKQRALALARNPRKAMAVVSDVSRALNLDAEIGSGASAERHALARMAHAELASQRVQLFRSLSEELTMWSGADGPLAAAERSSIAAALYSLIRTGLTNNKGRPDAVALEQFELAKREAADQASTTDAVALHNAVLTGYDRHLKGLAPVWQEFWNEVLQSCVNYVGVRVCRHAAGLVALMADRVDLVPQASVTDDQPVRTVLIKVGKEADWFLRTALVFVEAGAFPVAALMVEQHRAALVCSSAGAAVVDTSQSACHQKRMWRAMAHGLRTMSNVSANRWAREIEEQDGLGPGDVARHGGYVRTAACLWFHVAKRLFLHEAYRARTGQTDEQAIAEAGFLRADLCSQLAVSLSNPEGIFAGSPESPCRPLTRRYPHPALDFAVPSLALEATYLAVHALVFVWHLGPDREAPRQNDGEVWVTVERPCGATFQMRERDWLEQAKATAQLILIQVFGELGFAMPRTHDEIPRAASRPARVSGFDVSGFYIGNPQTIPSLKAVPEGSQCRELWTRLVWFFFRCHHEQDEEKADRAEAIRAADNGVRGYPVFFDAKKRRRLEDDVSV